MAAKTATVTDPAKAMRERIGTNIRLLLLARGKSTQDLWEAMGWSESTCSRRLSGVTKIPSEELAEVATFLRVGPGDLYRPTEELLASEGKYAKPGLRIPAVQAA